MCTVLCPQLTIVQTSMTDEWVSDTIEISADVRDAFLLMDRTGIFLDVGWCCLDHLKSKKESKKLLYKRGRFCVFLGSTLIYIINVVTHTALIIHQGSGYAACQP